jgi:hypothetical protein
MGPLDPAYRIVPPLRMDGLQKMDPASGKGKKDGMVNPDFNYIMHCIIVIWLLFNFLRCIN